MGVSMDAPDRKRSTPRRAEAACHAAPPRRDL